MQHAHRFLPVLALVAMSASSFAASTVYTTSASFVANVLAGSYTEDFNSLISPPPGPVAFTGGGFSYTVSSPGDMYASGAFLGTNLPNQAVTVTFTGGGVTAVGGSFYASDFTDALQSVAIQLTLADGTTTTFTPTAVADSFRGFTSSAPITSLVFSAPGASLYAGIDSLTVGKAAAVVPEPASCLLMALGVAGLWVARRRNA